MGSRKPGDTCGRKVRREKELRVRRAIKAGTGNGEPGTGNPPERPGGQAPGDTCGRKVRRKKELRVRRAIKAGTGNGEPGTGNPPKAGRLRELPKWQSAPDGREPGFGGRKPAFVPASRNYSGQAGSGGQAKSHGTWNPPKRPGGQALEPETCNCRSYLTPPTLRHNVDSSTVAPEATRGWPCRPAPRRPGRPRKPQ